MSGKDGENRTRLQKRGRFVQSTPRPFWTSDFHTYKDPITPQDLLHLLIQSGFSTNLI